jgi:glutamate/tyrosine decarboxylase-like PLP-dependent enzyme
MLNSPTPDHRRILDLAVAEVERYFEDLERLPVVPPNDAGAIREVLAGFDLEQGHGVDALVPAIADLFREHNLQIPHPRYFGLFNPAPSLGGVAADLLVAGFNPQAGAWHQSPVAVEIERHLVRWFLARFGLDAETGFGHFTSGGSEANATGILLALTRSFPAFRSGGLRALAAQPVFYVSREFHHSFEKVAHQCSLGRDAVRRVPVTQDHVMDTAALERTVRRDRATGLAPFAVVATAGTTNAGLIEPLGAIADVATREGLHFHVDAAWGGGLVISDDLRPHLAGIERADTLTFDPHKMLSVPMGAGLLLSRHAHWLEETFGLTTDYVPSEDGENLDNYRLGMQFSRRLAGLKLFFNLAGDGRRACADAVERQIALAERLKAGLESRGWRVLNPAGLGVACFEDGQGRVCPDALAAAVRHTRQAWISSTRLGGRPVVRACVTSHLAREHHVDELLELADEARAQLLREHRRSA